MNDVPGYEHIPGRYGVEIERTATSWRLASMAWRWSVDATRVTVTPAAQPV